MANDVIAIAAGIAGGLPPLHLPKRRERQPDPVAEAAAIAKRARRAAKRAEDERRTAEGRASYTPPEKLGFERSGWFTGWSVRLAQWDGAPYEMEWPRWRIRSRERRALPGMERPWFARYRGGLLLHTIIRHIGFGRARAMLVRGAL